MDKQLIEDIFFTDVMNILEETQDVEISSKTLHEMTEKFIENKKTFIDMFGGLSYTVPYKVQFSLSDLEKEKYFKELYYRIERTFKFSSNRNELMDFVSFCKKEFFDNIVPEKYSDNIPKGMKITRAFSKFDMSEDILRLLQDMVSEYIQKGKVNGYLTISVDPRDFLTMSDNNENWTSCMCLEGMYRRGILSYMLDSSTAICYLSNGKKESYNIFNTEWNSKKWRMLIHFSSNFNGIFCSRQYPFYSSSALKIVKDIFLDNFYGKDVLIDNYQKQSGKFHEVKGYDSYMLKKESAKSNLVMNFTSLIVEKENQYCDVTYANETYPVYYIERKPQYWVDTPYEERFYIGEYVPCLYCGEWQYEDFQIEESLNYTMMCNDCELEYGEKLDTENIATCEICGRNFIPNDDNIICFNDYSVCNVCDDCLQELRYCDKCGNPILDEGYAYYNEKTGEWCCEDCYVESEE